MKKHLTELEAAEGVARLWKMAEENSNRMEDITAFETIRFLLIYCLPGWLKSRFVSSGKLDVDTALEINAVPWWGNGDKFDAAEILSRFRTPMKRMRVVRMMAQFKEKCPKEVYYEEVRGKV